MTRAIITGLLIGALAGFFAATAIAKAAYDAAHHGEWEG